MKNIEFVVHEQATEAELKSIIAAVDASNTSMRTVIARNDQIKAQAQHRLISLQLAERE